MVPGPTLKALSISPATLLLAAFGAVDLWVLRPLLLPPLWSILANLVWVLVVAALVGDLSPWLKERAAVTRRALALAAIGVLGLGSTAMLIALRHTLAPDEYVHDNAVLIEEGIAQLRAGRNFYAVDYRGTALERWQGGRFYDATAQEWFANPALFHYITPPFYTLASLPVAVLSERTLGWYDQRFTHLLAYLATCVLGYTLVRSSAWRVIALLLLALNPWQVYELAYGSSDTFAVTFVVLTVWLLVRRRLRWAALSLALAAASKQTVWPAVPLLCGVSYLTLRAAGAAPRAAALAWLKGWWPLPAVFAALTLPFLLWDPRAFLDDTYRYAAGLLPSSFPISGYGLSPLLLYLGLPPSPRAYFPYGLLQALIAGPLLVALWRWLARQPTLARACVSAGVFLLVFLWLGRFFSGNYLTLVFALLALGYVLGGENARSETAIS